MHNDIKSDNIIIDIDDAQPKAYIIDVGMASNKGIPPAYFKEHTKEDYDEYDQYAPEYFFGETSHPASDVFCVGKMFIDILHNINYLKQHHMEWPGLFIRLLKSMTAFDHRDRPSITSVYTSISSIGDVKIFGDWDTTECFEEDDK